MQVLVDGKNFSAALDDYNAARERSADGGGTTQARLLAGRGLAFEGLGEWRAAVADYDAALQVAALILQ